MSDEAPKRRLPVLQNAAPEPPAEDRPPWRWAALGAVATFIAWLPLSLLTQTAVTRAVPLEAEDGTPNARAGVLLACCHALAFFAGAFAGGFLVGRLGDKVGRREAAAAGALAGALSWTLGISQGAPGGALAWGLLLVIILALGAGGGSLGGALGLRLRKRAAPPS
jgi:MFS family permease